MIPSLKFDQSLPHHYIICVGIKDINSNEPGKYFMKYKPIYFSNEDIENMRNAMIMMENKLWKTSQKDCLKIFHVEELFNTLTNIKISSMANNTDLYHFSMKDKINEKETENYFDEFIELCEKDKTIMEILKNARIR